MPLITGQTFLDYAFQAYPKWINLPNGSSVIVEDANEEYRLLGKSAAKEAQPEDTVTEFLPVEALDGVAEPELTAEEVADVSEGKATDVLQEVEDAAIADIDSLRSQADALGLIYDKRWGALKLQQAIDNARAQGALSAE